MTPGAAEVVAAIRRWQAEQPAPLVVAIDGYGASGKTTIAAEVAAALEASVVATDDYLHEAKPSGGGPMADYYDWAALRRASLEPTIATGSDLILLEGVSSGSPALADLVTHAIFVDTAEPVRLERLRARITAEEWDDDWLRAERVYFASRPPESFDLSVAGA